MNWIQSIETYTPFNDQEKADKKIILQCINAFENVLTRNNPIVHITCSAFAVNKSQNKVLMVYHNIYDSWSWSGGHADGEADLLAVAVKELQEETGVKNIKPISSEIFSLDILTVLGHKKCGQYISPHLHLSVAYLVEADENEALFIKEDENSGVRWIPIDEVNLYSNEPHMHKVYDKLIAKICEACF